MYHPGKDLLDALAHNPTINVPVNGPAEEDNLVAAVNSAPTIIDIALSGSCLLDCWSSTESHLLQSVVLSQRQITEKSCL